jgi:glycosyltransferase involved in cell wall biosynthesis
VKAVEKKQYLISVVIPVYNMMGYLERCIDSVLADFSDDMQIVLVDDGSTDESPAICDKYGLNNDDILVIHQQNSGISATRNAGISAAVGEYIFFLDSDDAAQPGIFSKFRSYIHNVEFKPDMLLFQKSSALKV